MGKNLSAPNIYVWVAAIPNVNILVTTVSGSNPPTLNGIAKLYDYDSILASKTKVITKKSRNLLLNYMITASYEPDQVEENASEALVAAPYSSPSPQLENKKINLLDKLATYQNTKTLWTIQVSKILFSRHFFFVEKVIDRLYESTVITISPKKAIGENERFGTLHK